MFARFYLRRIVSERFVPYMLEKYGKRNLNQPTNIGPSKKETNAADLCALQTFPCVALVELLSFCRISVFLCRRVQDKQ